LFFGEVSLAGFIQWFVVFLAFEACSFPFIYWYGF
jgi:hypothetical protein